MSSPRALTLGDFVGVARNSGDFRAVTGWAGWDDGPSIRSNFTPLTGADGAWVTSEFFGPRVVSIDGFVEQSTHAATTQVRDELSKMHPNTWLDLTVDDGESVRTATVKVTQGAVFQWVNDVAFRYAIQVTAPSPQRRSTIATTVAVAAGATVTHTADGTFPAEIEVTLTSAGTVDLTIAGLRLRTGSLPSGAVLTSGPGFTNPRRTIRSSSGANLFGLIVQPMQWPAMSPGGNSVHQAGSAGLSVRYFPTYA